MPTTNAGPNLQSARLRSKPTTASRCAANRWTKNQRPKLSEMEMERTSKRYAAAQTVLLILFAAVVFLSPRDYLFVSAGGVIGGNALCGVGLLVIVLAF